MLTRALISFAVALVVMSSAEAASCRSDRVTYVSKDKEREFVVEVAGRGFLTEPFEGGRLTSQLIVLKGRVGDKMLYTHQLDYIRNTSNRSTGTRPPMLAFDRAPETHPFKLTWRPWSTFYEKGEMAFHIFDWRDTPPEMLGSWFYAGCRGTA